LSFFILVQPKRYKAHLMGTTYIYDIPELFKGVLFFKLGSLIREWECSSNAIQPPPVLLNFHELILNQSGNLEPSFRNPGSNDIGMVAWEMSIFTPEYPEGRNLILIG
jgi:acetyl-CoA carboxylase/biotin carboxylase 1